MNAAKWVVLFVCSVAASSCEPKCPLYICRSRLTFGLGATERAVFDEGEVTAQVCVEATCFDFSLPAGAHTATTSDGDSELVLDGDTSQLLFTSSTFHEEKAREVKLIISRNTVERVNHTWPGTAFTFSEDHSNECAQSCVQATVSIE